MENNTNNPIVQYIWSTEPSSPSHARSCQVTSRQMKKWEEEKKRRRLSAIRSFRYPLHRLASSVNQPITRPQVRTPKPLFSPQSTPRGDWARMWSAALTAWLFDPRRIQRATSHCRKTHNTWTVHPDMFCALEHIPGRTGEGSLTSPAEERWLCCVLTERTLALSARSLSLLVCVLGELGGSDGPLGHEENVNKTHSNLRIPSSSETTVGRKKRYMAPREKNNSVNIQLQIGIQYFNVKLIVSRKKYQATLKRTGKMIKWWENHKTANMTIYIFGGGWICWRKSHKITRKGW